MIKEVYLQIRWLVLALLILLLILLILLFHPLALSKSAEIVLKNSDIHYSNLQGTFYSGFSIENLSYKKLFKAKKASIEFDLLNILLHGITIEKLQLENAKIDLNQLEPKDNNSSDSFTLPKITLNHLNVKNLELLTSETIVIDATMQNSIFDAAHLHVNSLNAKVKTQYVTLKLLGSVSKSIFSGKSISTLNKSYFKEYLKPFQSIPATFNIEVSHASAKEFHATVPIKHIALKQGNIAINEMKAVVDYVYAQKSIDINATYLLNNDEVNLSVQQQLKASFDGNYSTNIALELLHSNYQLPETKYLANIHLNQMQLDAEIHSHSGALSGTLSSSNMKHFQLRAYTTKLSTNFLKSLPQILHNRNVDASVDANISIEKALKVTGYATIGDATTVFNTSFQYDDAQLLAQGNVNVNEESEQWSDIQTKNFFPMNFVAHYNKDKEGMLALKSNEVYITLFKRAEKINGWGSYKTSRFDIKGKHSDAVTTLHINKHIASVYELVSSITPLHYKKFEYYDAELITKSTVTIDDGIKVESHIEVPWYVAQSDSQTINFGHNSSMKLLFEDNLLTIDEYNITMLEHNVNSKRDSKLYLDDNQNLHVKEFWIYENLKLSGLYDIKSSHIDMKLYSNGFYYKGKEAELEAAVDLTIVTDTSKNINIEGEVKLLEGLIKYYPSKSYMMQDDDIIILQDVRAPKESKFFVNVHVTSQKPLRYKAHDIDLNIKTDFTLWKELNAPLVLLGMAEVIKGKATLSDKVFEIEPSKLYFGGDSPINPYLDLNILHDVDFKRIQIYITNTLEDPVLLFSATPALSQNDIMSYLIFGTPANDAFEGGGDEFSGADAANLILGAGLKQMIGDTTGIHVDTLNIISSESGALGFEVGTRVSDKLRILLKNDSKFSAILQYKLNRWLRLDVDVKETGQGINLIYVKDLRDPFRKRKE